MNCGTMKENCSAIGKANDMLGKANDMLAKLSADMSVGKEELTAHANQHVELVEADMNLQRREEILEMARLAVSSSHANVPQTVSENWFESVNNSARKLQQALVDQHNEMKELIFAEVEEMKERQELQDGGHA